MEPKQALGNYPSLVINCAAYFMHFLCTVFISNPMGSGVVSQTKTGVRRRKSGGGPL
jgi:hypothetical protein